MGSLLHKVAWIGRATTFCVGMAVVLAVVLGVGTTALAAVPGDPFKLGRLNVVDRLTTLAASVPGAVLRLDNNGTGSALDLRVGNPTTDPASKSAAPIKVDSGAKVTNLNADRLDGQSAEDFLFAGAKATDADRLDGLDSNEFMRKLGRRVLAVSVSDSSASKTAVAMCPDGEIAVSGGANVSRPTINVPEQPPEEFPVALQQSVGGPGSASWIAKAAEMAPYDGDWRVSATVQCATAPPDVSPTVEGQ